MVSKQALHIFQLITVITIIISIFLIASRAVLCDVEIYLDCSMHCHSVFQLALITLFSVQICG